MLILPPTTITTAISPAVVGATFQVEPSTLRNLLLQAALIYGSGGTSVDAYIQTSLDAGATWSDIANFHFTTSTDRFLFNLSSGTPQTTELTPTDGGLANNTAIDGVIGDLLRVKYKSSGTYAGSTSLAIAASGVRIRS